MSVERAIALARRGAPAEARAVLLAYMRDHQDDPHAWFWLACVTDNTWELKASLQKVVELAPAYPGAQQGILWAEAQMAAGRPVEPMSAPFVPSPVPRGGPLPPAPAAPPLAQRPAEPQPAPPPSPRQEVAPEEAPPPGPATRPRVRPAGKPPAPARQRSRAHVWIFIAALLILAATALAYWYFLVLPAESAELEEGTPAAQAAPTPTATPATWEEAWERGDWQVAITHLELLAAGEPDNPEYQRRLFDARVQAGKALAENGRLDQALDELGEAMASRPYDASVQQAHGQASRYRIALDHYQGGNWPATVAALLPLYEEEGTYRETRDLLYSSYFNCGLAELAAGRLETAEEQFHLALAYTDDPGAVEKQLMRIDRIVHPPTATPTFKRIEVSISEQRFRAYNHDELVHDMICSTGSSASPTAPGSYRILDKLPNAYASTWGLEMPYWMGIYWSGTLENGIHALPILKNGQILWDGYLGQRVSFGCVILSTEDAKTIYEWADVGTPVVITP